ncbi:MAG: POTRA domain-containing protein, partial [Alloprevotella sp.]
MKMTSRLLLALLLLVITLTAKAQTPQHQDVPEITYTANHPSYILGGLTIEGAGDMDEELLKSISGLNIGDAYEVPGPDMTEAVQRYWRQKLFANVQMLADSIVGSSIYLRIVLTPHPRISSIHYTGVKKSEREECEKLIGLQPGTQITVDIVNRAEHYIKKHFQDKGFKNCEVEIVQREDVTADNRVLVDIHVKKNEKIKVKHIYIAGIDNRKQVLKLKKAMKKTHEKSIRNIFRSKKFLAEKYEEDKGFLIDKLNAWGYRDALITADSVQTLDAKHVNIYLDIYRGTKYYLRNVSWVGNTVYNTDLLERLLKMQRGDVYNQELLNKRLREDEDAIGNLYYN